MTRRTRLNTGVTLADIRKPRSNTVVALGDSITIGNGAFGYLTVISNNWFGQLCMQSKQRMRWAGAFATSGATLTQIRANHMASVLALNPLPGACIIAGGTNDVYNGGAGGWSLATTQATLKAMVNDLLSAGIVPILITEPPRSVSTLVNANMNIWNTWVSRYAQVQGFSVVDFYRALVDPATGLYKTGYDLDGTHPSGIGHSAIARQAITDNLPSIFPVAAPPTSKSSIDLSNMINNGTVAYGVFVTDTNADGVADGWTKSAGVASLVTPTAGDNLAGNWQQITNSSAGACALTSSSATTGFSVGDVLAFSARLQTEAIESTGSSFRLYANFIGSATPVNGVYDVNGDVADGMVYMEIPVPAATTSINVIARIVEAGAFNAKMRVGEVTLRNLTTGNQLVT